MTHTFDVAGMHCQSCVRKVSGALESVPGVASAAVALEPPTARVEMLEHVPTERLNQALQAVGGYQLREHRENGARVAAEGSRHSHGVVPLTSAPASALASGSGAAKQESLYPLFLIIAYIAGTVALVALATGERSPHELMRYFMAGFFLVFSFFKLLDLGGFADAYRSYDLLAKAWPAWSIAYPFVELALGVAYLLNLWPTATGFATLALMLLGSVGVLKALLDKQAIRCACLGTALNLPMTTVTLVEDLGMAAMAAIMLAIA